MISAIKWFYHPTVRPMYFGMDRAARRDNLAFSAHLAKAIVLGQPGLSPQEWRLLSGEEKQAEVQAAVSLLRTQNKVDFTKNKLFHQ